MQLFYIIFYTEVSILPKLGLSFFLNFDLIMYYVFNYVCIM